MEAEAPVTSSNNGGKLKAQQAATVKIEAQQAATVKIEA